MLTHTHLKQMFPKAFALVILIHIEVQNTNWLYLTERPSLNPDEEFLDSCFDATKYSQPAQRILCLGCYVT